MTTVYLNGIDEGKELMRRKLEKLEKEMLINGSTTWAKEVRKIMEGKR